MRSTSWRALVRVSALLGCVPLAAGAASAASLTVTSVADELRAGDGLCTLREAILNANGDSDTTGGDCPAGTEADEIMLPAGTYLLSIGGVFENAGAMGDLDIRDDLRITGSGSSTTTIDAGGIDRVLHAIGSEVTLEGVTITGGNPSSGCGGGLRSESSTLTLIEVTISNNEAQCGGGLSAFRGTSTLKNSTVSGNKAVDSCKSTACGYGGGVLSSIGDLSLVNSTVSGNIDEGLGAPVLIDGVAMLLNSTVAENSAPFGALGSYEGSAIFLSNSLLSATGTFAACVFVEPFSVTSGGHNIVSNGSCGLTHPTDLPNTDPMLGPLQDNGGPTETHALHFGSPAIDAIPAADCLDLESMPLFTDQRLVPRLHEGDGVAPALCDIGAYEVTPCADGIDNDGDGQIDFDGGATAGLAPEQLADPDPQCGTPTGPRESPSRCGLGAETVLLLAPLAGLHRRRFHA